MSLTSLRRGITATAYNRPDKLRNLLGSVAAAAGGRDWPLYLSIEPSDLVEENLAVARSFQDRLDLHLRVNQERRGVRHNPFDTVEWAFSEGVELLLLLEDDLVIEPQALRWCMLLADGPIHEPGVMCANLLLTTCNSESIYSPTASERAALQPHVLRTRFFSSYGLLFSRAQWQQHLRPHWFCDEPLMENWRGDVARGWDVAVNRAMLGQPGLTVLQSLVPRVKHDGAGGTHMSDQFQARSFDNLDLGDDAGELPDTLVVCDPEADLALIPSPQARMYINLCRHLWTLQEQSLRFKHQHAQLVGAKTRQLKIGSYDYLLFRKRARG